MDSQILSQFEQFIHQSFSGILSISPTNSLTPFEVQYADTEKSEILFIAKCTDFVYAPVKGRKLQEQTPIQFAMYNEGENLIVRFELVGIILESEIERDNIKAFLSTLFHQETITLAIVDAKSYHLIWLTNQISFRNIRFYYEEIFKKYKVI